VSDANLSQETIGELRSGIQVGVRRALRRGGRGLRSLTPPAVLALLCASAFSPLLVAAGVTSVTAVAGLGVAGALGAETLAEVIKKALERLAGAGGDVEEPGERVEREVEAAVNQALDAGGDRADRLRTEIASILQRIGAASVALDAVADHSIADRVEVTEALNRLGAKFGEFAFLVTDVHATAIDIKDMLELSQREHAADRELHAADRDLLRRILRLVKSQSGIVATAERRRAGDPVRSWRPADLGVNNAIEPPPGEPVPAELPAFIPRDHDEQLRNWVREARSQAKPVVAVLVGGRSAGKSRSAYEVLQDLPQTWRLYRPAEAADLSDDVRDGRIGPDTVVWLDDAHGILDGQPGCEAAAALRQLVHEAWDGRWAVVVLASMPQKQWKEMTDPESFAVTRKLLESCQRLPVPEDFKYARAQSISAARLSDPRIREAMAVMGERGRLAQYLAGGVFLISHYDNAYPAERAVLDAALDARLLGFESPLPPELLTEAARGYPGVRDGGPLPANWFSDSLNDAQRLQPAAAIRLADDIPAPHSGYRVADFLVQHAERDVARESPPAVLWDALLRHASETEDRHRIAEKAYARGFYRHATIMWAGHEAGNLYAHEKLARIIPSLSDTPRRLESDEAEWAPRGSSGNPLTWGDPLWWMACGLIVIFALRSGADLSLRLAVSAAWLSAAVIWIFRRLFKTAWFNARVRRDPEAMRELARRLERRGLFRRSLKWLTEARRRQLIAAEPAADRRWRSRLLEAMGDIDGAVVLFRPGDMAEELLRADWYWHDPPARWWIPESPHLVLLRAGRTGAALAWLRQAEADRRGPRSREIAKTLAEMLTGQREFDEAADCLLRHGVSAASVIREMVTAFLRNEYSGDVVRWIARAAQENRTKIYRLLPAAMDLAEHFVSGGDLASAERLLRALLESPRYKIWTADPRNDARLRLAELLTEYGAEDRARGLYFTMMNIARMNKCRACERNGGEEYALFLARRGLTAELLGLYGYHGEASEAGFAAWSSQRYSTQILPAVKFLPLLGRKDLAADYLHRFDCTFVKVPYVFDTLVTGLELSGDVDEAITLYFRRCMAGFAHADGLLQLKTVLARNGRIPRALQIDRYGIEPSGQPALPWHPCSKDPALAIASPAITRELNLPDMLAAAKPRRCDCNSCWSAS
jgi:hypothetical protein